VEIFADEFSRLPPSNDGDKVALSLPILAESAVNRKAK
jgi:hypothetical protein